METEQTETASILYGQIVKKRNKSFLHRLPDWVLVRACAEGQRQIKNGKIKYLPLPSSDVTVDSYDYTSYIARASFANFVGRTQEALVGLAFAEKPLYNSAEWGNAEYIVDNADGAGTELTQHIKQTLGDVVLTGRGGLLVDYPNTANVNASPIKPASYITYYPAESILDWEVENVNGTKRVQFVLLRERRPDVNELTDLGEGLNQFRYLHINADGFVEGVLLDKRGVQIGEKYDVVAGGERLTELPFFFVSANNTLTSSNIFDAPVPPLLKIANLNVTHYQTDAEMRLGMHYHANPQPFITGATPAFIKKYETEPMRIGTAEILLFEQGTTFGLAQAQFSATPFHDELNRLRDSIVEMGGRLVTTQTGGAESTETVRLRESGDLSIMASIINSVSDAYESAVELVGRFMGTGEIVVEITLQTELLKRTPDGALLGALQTAMSNGVVGVGTLRNYLRNTGIIASGVTDDELNAEVFGSLGGVESVTTAEDIVARDIASDLANDTAEAIVARDVLGR